MEDNKVKFHLTNNYLSCDTCNKYDKLIRLFQFNLSIQEEQIFNKGIHLVNHHHFER